MPSRMAKRNSVYFLSFFSIPAGPVPSGSQATRAPSGDRESVCTCVCVKRLHRTCPAMEEQEQQQTRRRRRRRRSRRRGSRGAAGSVRSVALPSHASVRATARRGDWLACLVVSSGGLGACPRPHLDHDEGVGGGTPPSCHPIISSSSSSSPSPCLPVNCKLPPRLVGPRTLLTHLPGI